MIKNQMQQHNKALLWEGFVMASDEYYVNYLYLQNSGEEFDYSADMYSVKTVYVIVVPRIGKCFISMKNTEDDPCMSGKPSSVVIQDIQLRWDEHQAFA